MPNVKFDDAKAADESNIIDSETLSPGYTLQGKAIKLLSSGEEYHDDARLIFNKD